MFTFFHKLTIFKKKKIFKRNILFLASPIFIPAFKKKPPGWCFLKKLKIVYNRRQACNYVLPRILSQKSFFKAFGAVLSLSQSLANFPTSLFIHILGLEEVKRLTMSWPEI